MCYQGIKQSPVEAMFGRKMQLGLSVYIMLPASVTATTRTEKELTEVTLSINSIDAEVDVGNEEIFAGIQARSDDENTDSVQSKETRVDLLLVYSPKLNA